MQRRVTLTCAMAGIRIAYFSNFAPKKLGTGEGRLMAFAREARLRGHIFTLFGREPVHPDVESALRVEGADWQPLAGIEAQPIRASRMLARAFDVIQLNMIAPRSRAALAAYFAYPATVLYVDRLSRPPADQETPRAFYKRLLDRLTLMRVKQLAGITNFVRDRAKLRWGLSQSRVTTIYNGVDVQRFSPKLWNTDGNKSLTVVVVAALIADKGVDILMRALASLESGIEFTLTVVGEGPLRSDLEEYAKVLGIDERTHFLGLSDDVPEIMASADIVVHPAIWQEALGNTVLEGMACGRCVIASRVGGIPELIEDGEHGLLFDAGDVQALARTIRQAAGDAALRQRLGAAARERVLERFTLAQSISKHLDWCEENAR